MREYFGEKMPLLIVRIAICLLFVIIPLLFFFLNGEIIDFSEKIDSGKFGTFGDFFGGVIGSFWSLCGVFLFYTALVEQRKDFNTNKEALLKQIDALEIQSYEFKLQRQEMEMSRDVFREQSKTLIMQRFDATFFSLIELYQNILRELTLDKKILSNVKRQLASLKLPEEYQSRNKAIVEKFSNCYFLDKENLGSYFRNLYRILKIIDQAEMSDVDKFRYSKILRSLLSENEMLIIYYNSHSIYGGEMYKLILKYNLLKHLNYTTKTEFTFYLDELSDENKAIAVPIVHGVTEEIVMVLKVFHKELDYEIKKDGFCKKKISTFLKSGSGLKLSVSSEETYEVLIRLDGFDCISKYFDLTRFVKDLLWDSYWLSNFKQISEFDEIRVSVEGSGVIFEVKSHDKLTINMDME